MKNKMLVLGLSFVMALTILSGCTKQEDVLDLSGTVTNDETISNPASSADSEEPKENEDTQTANGYVFVYQGTEVAIGMDMVSLYESLGGDASRSVSGSCKYDGEDADYTFSDFKVTAFIDGDAEKIYSIELTSDLVETKEGLAIGDDEDAIIAAYGQPKEAGFYKYEADNMQLLISVEDGVVTSISYIEQ